VAVAALTLLVRRATLAADLLFVGALTAVVVFSTVTFRRLGAPFAGPAVAVLVFACPLLLDTKGMETLPFLAVAGGLMWATATGRLGTFGALGAALVLVRGEGIFLVGALFVALWLSTKRFPTRAVIAGATVALPWVVYSAVTLRSLVPDTMAAKVAQTHSGFWGTGHLFFRGFFDLADPLHYKLWLLVVAPLAAVGLVRGVVDRSLRLVIVPLVVSTAFHLLAYGIVLNVPAYYWYYAWEIFTLAVLAALAISWAIERAVASLPGIRGRQVRLAAIASLGVLCIVAAASTTAYTSNHEEHYVAVGRWLAANTSPDARVAATEIGTTGWYSQRPMVDYLGLLSTTSITEVDRGDLLSWLEREQPDYWVVHSPLWPFEVAATQPWFSLAYEQVYVGDPIGDSGTARLVVYRRVRSVEDAKAALAAAGAPTPIAPQPGR
jgi:hypothetical protein